MKILVGYKNFLGSFIGVFFFYRWMFKLYQTISAPTTVEPITVFIGGAETVRIPFDSLDAANEKGQSGESNIGMLRFIIHGYLLQNDLKWRGLPHNQNRTGSIRNNLGRHTADEQA